MNKGWLIKENQKSHWLTSELYYSGYTYVHEGEWYGEFRDKISEAKVYTSKKRAINAMEKLKLKVGNWDKLEVISF